MPLIDGIGDEVVQFAVAVIVTAVAAVAWWSTNARPDRYRTVLVMRSRANLPVTFSIRTRSNLTISNIQTPTAQASTSDPAGEISGPESSESRETRVIPLQEMDSIVDADMAMLDNHRLHFYRRVDSPSNAQNASDSSAEELESHEETEPASNAQIREMDSIVSAMEAADTRGCDLFARAGEPNAAVTAKQTLKVDNKAENPSSTDNLDGNEVPSGEIDPNARILIRLKYLNDTLKEVEGSLDELLKDFKWRHFSAELAAEARVRLIFNGRVLSDERATLRACGLRDRAVVHCLVHPRRAPAQQQHGLPEDSTIAAGNELLSEGNPRERPWDLENILLTLVSVALTVVWFFRCEYSNMFTASASVALFGLTVFYSVAIFGLYLSDTFHFDRRPAQPVPDN